MMVFFFCRIFYLLMFFRAKTKGGFEKEDEGISVAGGLLKSTTRDLLHYLLDLVQVCPCLSPRNVKPFERQT